ncbi:Dynein light chain, type 1/2 [Cinara cedri]|uniref:Dynein light chain n=1 Tax=Cinara cedri TaxID=506608 RepID=A0A5E4LYG3_9HEMI|nr:Dynein light chain, type 1/2 [Cinara cedri]
MSDHQAVVINADMSEEMEENAVDYATRALEKYSTERDMAASIAESFNKRHNPTWNCIVGREFASSFSHGKGYFVHFYLGHLSILLFKCA